MTSLLATTPFFHTIMKHRLQKMRTTLLLRCIVYCQKKLENDSKSKNKWNLILDLHPVRKAAKPWNQADTWIKKSSTIRIYDQINI